MRGKRIRNYVAGIKYTHKLREREEELRINARYTLKRYREGEGNARKSQKRAQVMRKRRRNASKCGYAQKNDRGRRGNA